MPSTVHPIYRSVTHAIVANQNIELSELPHDPATGIIDPESLAQYSGVDFAALVIPQPNFFGALEEVDALTDWAEENKVFSIAVINPTALGVLKPPGEWGKDGVDIVCGEGQPLGAPLSSGGPYFGILTCKQKHVRQMPGRIVGGTTDADDKAGFVLTLQAREQHIRRSKATSNICTNQGLMVTAATIYMSLVGNQGLKSVAAQCYANTHQLVELAAKINVTPAFSGEFFHEVVFDLHQPVAAVLEKMADQGILGGYDLGRQYAGMENYLLVCSTETKTEEDLNQFITVLDAALNTGD
jgi:glycine dehydrogenase subunit 1